MSNHPYLRAYMAGISVPTPLLLIPVTAFFVARFVYNIPVPIERVIIFPMAIIPNLFGVWNVLHLACLVHTRLLLGIHGAILPFIIALAGFLLGRGLGFLHMTHNGFIDFGVVEIHYTILAVVFPLARIASSITPGYRPAWPDRLPPSHKRTWQTSLSRLRRSVRPLARVYRNSA